MVGAWRAWITLSEVVFSPFCATSHELIPSPLLMMNIDRHQDLTGNSPPDMNNLENVRVSNPNHKSGLGWIIGAFVAITQKYPAIDLQSAECAIDKLRVIRRSCIKAGATADQLQILDGLIEGYRSIWM